MTMAEKTRADDECTPAARITKSLFGYGVIAGPFYVLASVIDGATRAGFDFTRDSWSVLSLGPRGWIHIVVFILTGLMVAAAAVAMRRHLAPGLGRSAAGFLGFYSLMLVLAGIFQPDPTGGSPTLHGILHLAAGGLGFIAFAVTTFVLARRFFRQSARGWAWFSIAAGALLIIGFGFIASGTSSALAVLVFTGTVILSWVWLTLVSLRFYREADAIGRADAQALKSEPVRG
jgi:hypothetical protein